jgi:hypothetical protein
MKRIILAALLAASTLAQAQSFAYTENSAGGRIVISASDCYVEGQKLDPLKSAFTHTKNGVVTTGCWFYENETEMIHVIWLDDGERRVYPVTRFQALNK